VKNESREPLDSRCWGYSLEERRRLLFVGLSRTVSCTRNQQEKLIRATSILAGRDRFSEREGNMAEEVSRFVCRLRAGCLIAVSIQLGCMSVVPGFCQEKEPRIALVIGNSNYSTLGKLANPGNDAADMAKALQGLGFSVTLLKDADQRSMEQGVVRLGNALSASPSAIGFFFYAGHGVQSNGISYLIPANAEIPSEAFLNTKAVALQALLDTLQQAGNKLNLVVLDACRDNPFSWSRSGTRGLSVVSAQPPGSLIAYATSAGSVAADGKGRNGIYTGELLKNLSRSDMSIFDVFLQTGAQVKAITNGAQVPAIYNQFFDKVYLARVPDEIPSSAPAEKLTGKQLDQYCANLARARDAEGRGAWGDALSAYGNALAALPGSEPATWGLAHSYWMLGNKRKAGDLFREILQKGSVPNYWNYGELADFFLNALRDPETALPVYSKALTCTPAWDLGWTYRGRGLAYRATGDVPKARADLEHALAIGEFRSMEDLVKECRKDLAALEQ
jgi:tetratricopeptide (TPR) repeat protein